VAACTGGQVNLSNAGAWVPFLEARSRREREAIPGGRASGGQIILSKRWRLGC